MANVVKTNRVEKSLDTSAANWPKQFSEVGKKKQLLIGIVVRSFLIRQKFFNFIFINWISSSISVHFFLHAHNGLVYKKLHVN